ncbi:DUF4097 family beta strand repeat-containing protein [Halosimplex salinum]|uniref:DUF4097 family beta strand repeat-containing protein n=1 Tax=Halosimplex salinum TaxID=1710538 RepID=UPI000F46A44B|nr:DUF4097 family beta strand repeat-containing protein [Halosimplex salinum]
MPSPDATRATRRRYLRTSAALVGGVGLAGCIISTEPYTETVEQEFDPGDAEDLAVETEDGDVTLSPGDGDTVSATVEKRSVSGEDALDDVTVEGRVEDGTLIIAPDRPDRGATVSVSLDLSVPEGLAVTQVTSSNGEVSADDVSGDGTYRTSNGDVDVDGVDGFVTVESTNGDVSASDVGGLDGARTTNGDVTVDAPAVRQDVTCESTNGDVTVAAPSDLDASVSLRTSNGDAEVSGVAIETTRSGSRRIEGRLGGGEDDDPEYELELRSTNGDVTLLGL